MFISLKPTDSQFLLMSTQKNHKTLHQEETFALAFVQNMDDISLHFLMSQ